MSTLTKAEEPRTRLWTADEFYDLFEKGFFHGERVELVEGEIVQMSPQQNLHGMGICMVFAILQQFFQGDYWVRPQMSLDLSSLSVVDPDVAVVDGAMHKHDPMGIPTTALLIVEVSVTTLQYDRNIKSSLYAKANIEDYWILNLKDRQLEVHRQPQADASQPYGFGYGDIQILDEKAVVAPLAKPNANIKVVDMLP